MFHIRKEGDFYRNGFNFGFDRFTLLQLVFFLPDFKIGFRIRAIWTWKSNPKIGYFIFERNWSKLPNLEPL